MVVLEGVGEDGGHSSSRVMVFRQKSSVMSRRASRQRARMSVAELISVHARMQQCGFLHSSCRAASTTVYLSVKDTWTQIKYTHKYNPMLIVALRTWR